MVNVKDINKKYEREFLAAKHIKDATNKTLVITNSGEIVVSHFKNKDGSEKFDLKLNAEMDGEKYIFTPNFNMRLQLTNVLGEDTDAWVGAQINLDTFEEDKMVDGVKKKQLRMLIATLPSEDPEETIFDITKNSVEEAKESAELSDAELEEIAEQY